MRTETDNRINLIDVRNKKRRLEILHNCMNSKNSAWKDEKTHKIYYLPIFLKLIYKCMENDSHRQYFIFHREDIIRNNIHLVQKCNQCDGKTNLVEVRK